MINRRTRERAALICAIAASSSRRRLSVGTTLASEALGLDSSGPEVELAGAAFQVALAAWQRWLGPYRRPIPVFAEAEAMLRSGWSP